jgi:NADPH-ferrihemoprotein reductase
MAQLDTLDIIVLVALLLGTVAYFTKGTYWAVQKDPYATSLANGSASRAGRSRNILEKMQETGKNCVVFYGSQTGTAEDYASRLAKEGSSRFGLKTMTADLEEYDYENLDQFPEDNLAIFVLATYGEGEPTDNAVEFYEFIGGEDVSFSEKGGADGEPLGSMKYVAFGLGNNTYEHYNSMVRNVTKYLDRLGAKRIGDAGEGDDGAGTMEEDFLAWKEPMWSALADAMSLEEREAVYEPVFEVTEKEDLEAEDATVYLGEPNRNHLEGSSKGPYNAHNPYIAPIAESTEIFQDKTRNCLHLEVDISGSNLSYTTGDHIAVWPTNSGKEVDRFLDVLNMKDKRNTVITVKGLDATAKVPFPSPTTYEAAVRYHMEICAAVSRQMVDSLAQFAPNEDLKTEVSNLGKDKDLFAEKVANKNYNIAQFLESFSQKWDKIPFSFFIEGMHKLQPRYYSISSSSMAQKKKIGITAVVASDESDGGQHVVKGVTTNYLLALKQKQHGEPNPDPHGLEYALNGPRNKYDGIHVPVHVRHSNFKLPSDPAKPIIMVGPGSGVAPFRGFVQERAEQKKKGENVGKTMLFFGCRREKEDFIYREKWEVSCPHLNRTLRSLANNGLQQWGSELGDAFELVTAFSRDGPQKVYVQHRIKERAEEVNKLLEQKAYFYVCGDAAYMARDVSDAISTIISEQRGVTKQKGEEIVKGMRAANQYQEDVWS